MNLLTDLARRLGATVALSLVLGLAGCGGSSEKEIEIVAPEASVPIYNPDTKNPMANISVENEAQHPEIMKGSTVPAGRR
jgi:hypothetical protein